MTDTPALTAANPRIWGQVGAPGTLFAPLAHIFQKLPGESALLAVPACCPDLPVAAQLLVSASDAPRCPECLAWAEAHPPERPARPRYLFSVERLVHYRCPECGGWWAIGDGPVDRALRCPHCAAQLEPPEPGA